jgi:two-component system, cell cycle response regulator
MSPDFKTIVGKKLKKPGEKTSKKACLAIITGKEIGKTYTLKKEETIIGRNEESTFQINEDLISRKHAAIILQDKNKVKLIDLESTNGTYVNFKKIKEAYLADGDKITFGQTTLKFIFKDPLEVNFHDEIYKLAAMDGLTQIYNKINFKEHLDKEISLVKRQKTPLSIAMMDIDFFKKINDTHGHQAGDYILATLAGIIKKCLRKEDVFGRYGGEEFCILLKNTTIDKAFKVAEKIRTKIETSEFIYDDKKIPVTLSIGVYAFDESIANGDKFIEKADSKLYESKENGRNQTTK